ncbi:penicillin acylase family protein [Nocardiopsis sp. HNM0947]|uniref:Penicillin acylase family protein n=1 Tax=Nocardiopsis coralli TaxID=2772213 RepID=A0ABR9PEX0_9ACTN|nr:penicillin acylase family protein [Nocardiopsis coralli]MBE3002396.1 penicillin acylase family protein [Nocardiopsis coralli]
MGVLRKHVLVRVLLGFLATATVLALIAALLSVWAVRRPFPQTSGELDLPGLASEVTVVRDEHGVTDVYADHADDLFMAQGFTHAQDRFWEMDFRRHVTAGRVSELFGPEQLETDIFLRTMGWRHVAEQEYELLDEDTRAHLDAYADGVNAWLEQNGGASASLEHSLLTVMNGGHEIEPWEPADSLAWLKAMAWDLSGNMEEETERGRLLADGFDEEAIDELFPPYPYDEHAPTTLTEEHAEPDADASPEEDARRAPADDGGAADDEAGDGDTGTPEAGDAALERVAASVEGVPDLLGPSSGAELGSNAWVVSGEHTESGAPLLANDPHLGASMPSTWYQGGLHCTEITEECPYDVSGFGFAGLPGVVIGQNESIAWGFTNLYPDVMDLYLEDVDGTNHRYGDESLPVETREETVEVQGGNDVDITVRSTVNGPIISDAQAGADQRDVGRNHQDGSYDVSLRWTALEPGRTADAIFLMNRARDWDGFRDAARTFEVPSQNLVYADAEGNIGYQAPGHVPVRGEGDGRYPAPGWEPDHAWEDRVPFEELPSVLNPESGLVVTANQASVDDEYAHMLTDDWDYGYRGARINDLAEEALSDGPVGVEDMERMHMDSYHLAAEPLVPHLVAADVDGVAAQAQAQLADWDLYTDPDSAGAAFYQATWRHLLPELFDEIEPLQMSHNSRGMYVVNNLLEDPDSPWWEGEDTSGREEVLAAAMEEAADELEDLLGDDPAEWRWGDLHTLTATHESFGTSGISAVERLFNRGPVESSGGSGIVNATGWEASEGYGIVSVPSMRMVVDLSDRDASTWVNLTGNSGHAFHSNYDDQLDLWSEGGTLPWAVSEEAVQEKAEDELVLRP